MIHALVQPKKCRNVLFVTHWSLGSGLIHAYTLPYCKQIRSILGAKSKLYLLTSDTIEDTNDAHKTEKLQSKLYASNIVHISHRYNQRGLKKLFYIVLQVAHLVYIIRRNKIDTLHAFCTPAGSLAVVLKVITGCTLIIDSLEPHAESMIETGTWNYKTISFYILFAFEWLQVRLANSAIATTNKMKSYCATRYRHLPANFFVKPACVDLDKFYTTQSSAKLVSELSFQDKIVCVYAGKIGGIYLDFEIFHFVRICYQELGDTFRFLLLTESSADIVMELMAKYEIPPYIVYQQKVHPDNVPEYLSISHFALNPVRPIPTKRYCTSIKDGEYWASGLPVIITKDIGDDSDIIERLNIGYVLNELSYDEYRKALYHILDLLQLDESSLNRRARHAAEEYRSFASSALMYESVYSCI